MRDRCDDGGEVDAHARVLVESLAAELSDEARRDLCRQDIKGANQGDIPVEQPTTIELVINLATAKTLGRVIPQSLPLRADDVIR